ncbi:MAG: ComEA family DNA-binding protein [Gemmatimonadetes bacterium]|nr:ComEA family DNA-binding protein [Gemmatimonadota bacterium]
MTELETRTLARASILLLVAAGTRWGWEARRPLPLFPVDSSGVLPRLVAEGEAARVDAAMRTRPLAEGERLDPNVASEVELDRLPGVGPAVARALVESREREGPFRGAEDLERVRGVGPATVAKLAEHLEFGAAGLAVRVVGGPSDSAAVVGGGPPPLDLNRATTEELEALPGVGPALAERILALRARRGRFGRVEDLLEVRGIGPATLDRLRARVRVR